MLIFSIVIAPPKCYGRLLNLAVDILRIIFGKLSDMQEKSVCKALGGDQVSNSGAGRFKKGDVIVKSASLLVECKCQMTEKDSYSVRKETLLKNSQEAFDNRLSNSCLCFNFGPETDNYYVISEKLMRYLVEKLEEDE